MKLLISTLILALSLIHVAFIPTALAQSSTDSATQVPEELVQENIKNRLDKVVQEKATQSGEVLATKSLIKRGWVGTLEDLAQKTLTIKTKYGTRQASFSDATAFVESPGKKTLKSTDLEIGANVIAIGFVNGNGVMDLRRLIVVTQDEPAPQRFVKLASVIDFDSAKKILTVTAADGQSTLTLSAKTIITQGKDQTKTDTKALTPDIKLLFITQADTDGNLTVLRLHLL